MGCLTNTDRTPFQYKNAYAINTLIDGFFNLADEVAPCDLKNFFDKSTASGDWLTQLAGLFNVPRVYSGLNNAFIWGVSEWGGTDVWGGTPDLVTDSILKALLDVKISRNATTRITVEKMYANILLVVTPDILEITEGDKTITVKMRFYTTPSDIRIVSALINYNTKWFGVPSGCSVTYDLVD